MTHVWLIAQIDGALAAPSIDGVSQQLAGRPGSTVLLKLRRMTPHGEEFDLAHMTREILSDGMYRARTAFWLWTNVARVIRFNHQHIACYNSVGIVKAACTIHGRRSFKILRVDITY